jgi:hypothetical protein
MWLTPKARPILASLTAAAVACWPVFFVAAGELLKSYGLMRRADWGDDLSIGLNLAPWIFLAAVVLCFITGQMLLWLGISSARQFIIISAAIALLFSLLITASQIAAFRFAWTGVVLTFSQTLALSLASMVPAAFCWWSLAVRPHNSSLDTDATRRST